MTFHEELLERRFEEKKETKARKMTQGATTVEEEGVRIGLELHLESPISNSTFEVWEVYPLNISQA